MIYYATAEQIQQYQQSPGLNQSSLKKIIEDVIFFKDNEPENFYEEKEHFLIGSGVDVSITQIEADFRDQFYVMEKGDKPSDKLMSCIQRVFSTALSSGEPISNNFRDYPQLFYMAFNEHEYYMNLFKPNWEEDKRISKLEKESKGDYYWNALYSSLGRTVLSTEQYNLVWTIKNSILTHPHTSMLFKLAQEFPNDYDLVFQVPVYFYYDGVLCKGLLDACLVNHKTKAVYPIDIKTTMKLVLQFPQVIRERRYDFQAAYYTEGLKGIANLRAVSSIINKDISNYFVKNFVFVVESTKFPGSPGIFECTKELLYMGKFGRPAIYSEGIQIAREVKGFQQCIEEYKYYCENGFDTNKILKESKGRLKVNWEGIVK